MVSIATNLARFASPANATSGASSRFAARERDGDSPAPADDAAIRREFEALAGRIRTLQQRAAREAAALSGR